MTPQLKDAIEEIGEHAVPVRLPADLWQRGRRQRRRARQAAVAASLVILVVALSAVFGATGTLTGRPELGLATAEPAIPGRLHQPWLWQATVQQSPPGAAALLMTGVGPGLEFHNYYDPYRKVAVIGQDGSYRTLLRGIRDVPTAGQNVQLSPDGRFVASGFTDRTDSHWIEVTDLETGDTRSYPGPDSQPCCALPAAWSPDGRQLLVVSFVPDPNASGNLPIQLAEPGTFALLDLASGAITRLGAAGGDWWALPVPTLAAFAPDGQRIAVTVDDEIQLLDLTGRLLWTSPLPPGTQLAGSAAFTPDGKHVLTAQVRGCLDQCSDTEFAERTWSFAYLDAATGLPGVPADGAALPDVQAMAMRAAGWRNGTDLVLVTNQPDDVVSMYDTPLSNSYIADPDGSDLRVIAAQPGRGIETLLVPPPEVSHIDFALDLVKAGSFGGPDRAPEIFPARPVIVLPILLLSIPVNLLCLLVALLWMTRRITAGWREIRGV